MAKSFVAKNKLSAALVLAGIFGLNGCTSVGQVAESNRIDYKSASKIAPTTLDVPPDLTQIRRDNRFSIPEVNQGTATASSYKLQIPKAGSTTSTVALNQIKDMRIDRDGSQRWLVIKQTPEALWPVLKEFWQDLGFQFVVENQEAGVLETDWAENRANIPQDFIRETIGKVFDSVYSTGERDKYRTRLERTPDGNVEIFISHRGAQEVFVGAQNETTKWTPRPSDSGLEAEILSRLLVKLGTEGEVAKSAVTANSPTTKERAKLATLDGASYVETDEGFDRSWRRVGLALDRIGFTVEDRDRSKGLYFVRYVDFDLDSKGKGEQGFFSKLFSSSDKNEVHKYRIYVVEEGSVSHVTVHGTDGKVEVSAVADKVLKLLYEQLK